MRKLYLSLIVSSFLSASAHAGVVVSDPGSYARQAQELQQLQEHLKTLNEQLEAAKKTQDAITGNYKRAKNLLRDIDRYAEKLKDATRAVTNLKNLDLKDLDLSNILDARDYIDEIYKDGDTILQRSQTQGQRNVYKLKSSKAALENSEVIINSQEERLNKIQTLADEIDSTEELKDSIDVNNRLLAELLLSQQELLNLQAQNIRAEQAANYRHIESELLESDPNKTKGDKSFINEAIESYSDQIDERIDNKGWEAPLWRK